MSLTEQVSNTPKIQVLVRKRPLTSREEAKAEIDIVRVLDEQSLTLLEEKEKLDTSKYTEEHRYHFDCIFDEKTTNSQIYQKKIRPLVAAALNNTHVSCFAYGQTGSGKTFTMMGTNPKNKSEGGVPGLYLLAANDIFTLREQLGLRHVSVGVSLFEIYMEKAYDLLNSRKECPVRVDEKNVVHIVGLSEQEIANVDQLMNIIDSLFKKGVLD